VHVYLTFLKAKHINNSFLIYDYMRNTFLRHSRSLLEVINWLAF